MLKEGTSIVAIDQPQVTLDRDDEVTFRVNYDPIPHRAYALTVAVEDKHGQSESHAITLIPASN